MLYHPREAARALDAWRIHPCLSAAILQEGVGVKGQVEFAQVCASCYVSKCIRQGTAEAQRIFLAAILSILAPLVLAWESAGRGFSLESGCRLTLIAWADNFWLFGANEADGLFMLQQLSDAFSFRGFSLKPSYLIVMSSPGVPG